MCRSTLCHIRDWLGVVAAFGTVLFLTLASPLAKPPHVATHSADEATGDLYAAMN